MINNGNDRTIGEYLETNNMTMKDLAASNDLSVGELMDLMNMDYDKQNPIFGKKVQLKIYKHAHQNGMAKIVPLLEENMVMNPETIGLSKDSHCFDGMEQGINAIKEAYNLEASLENTQTRTR